MLIYCTADFERVLVLGEHLKGDDYLLLDLVEGKRGRQQKFPFFYLTIQKISECYDSSNIFKGFRIYKMSLSFWTLN